MKANTILDTIGNTPLVRLNRIFAETRPDVEIWVKLERANPGGSIKDRIALSMIVQAEKDGTLTKDSLIVEPTSSNTGVGLALVAAVRLQTHPGDARKHEHRAPPPDGGLRRQPGAHPS